MAEGVLGGVLGNEDERPEVEAPETLAGADAFAAAVAARLSGNDPGVARKTEVFLEKQARLLDTQRQHLEDEHALRLAQLTHQRSLLRGQRIGQAIRIAFQIGIALVVLVIGAGIAVMLHDAFTSHSVVVDSFNAPAELAPRGVTGTVVASDILNELTRLQAATRSIPLSRQKRSLSNAWSNEVKIDVPETGVSLGEISRLLKARFGHDLHIGGSLVETGAGGLALTVSGDDLLPRTFAGGANDLDTLVVEAAQYVYSQFQPALWARYLFSAGRCTDAIAFIKSAYAGTSGEARASLLNDWGNCTWDLDSSPASLRAALELYRTAIEVSPDFLAAYENGIGALEELGDEEGAWREIEAFRTRFGARISPSMLADLTGDFGALLNALTADAAATAGRGSFGSRSVAPWIAELDVRLHDPSAATLMLQTVPASDRDPETVARVHLVRGLVAAELGDATEVATELDAFTALLPNLVSRGFHSTLVEPRASCEIAPIDEAAGRAADADAILADPANAHFVDCLRFRGDILDHRGDWSGAQQAYAQAVALAPDLPFGYYSWGVALARHGDLGGAIAKLQAASRRGPHWADPLKAWGDVLIKQGHPDQALAKYDEALKYAPNWAALKQARAAAAGNQQ